MEEQIIKLLSDLSAFNKLDRRVIQIISDVFKINALEICRENGITYFEGKKIVEITSKDVCEPEEIWTSIFKCPNCHQDCISQYDNYCNNCGTKVNFTESAKKYFEL